MGTSSMLSPPPALLTTLHYGAPPLQVPPLQHQSSLPPLLALLGTPASVTWSPWGGSWNQQSLTGSFSMTPPPIAPDWVVDSGASYDTTIDADTLSHSHLPHPSFFSSISVGNDSTLLVTLVGDSILSGPFHLKNVLVTSNIIQNLLYVRRFTVDNSCSVEFDSFVYL